MSEKVPSSSIAAANAEVTEDINQDRASTSKRGQYTKLSAEARAEIGKRASECGIASTIRHYAGKYPNLKESSVCTWKAAYLVELKRRRECNEILDIVNFPKRKTDEHTCSRINWRWRLEHI